MKNLIHLLALVFFFVSCGNNNQNKEALTQQSDGIQNEIAPTNIKEDTSNQSIQNENEVIEKKIIKDGRIGIEVKNVLTAKSHIDTLIKVYGGYYANENLNNVNQNISYHLNIRIPSNNFDLFISSVETKYGKLLYKEITSRDVTEQFIDLKTRLENKKNYLKRYNELLQKANTIKEILEIEEKIRNLEEEIESTTGQLKYLNDKVNYSSLELRILKPIEYTRQKDNFLQRIKRAVFKGWYGLVNFFVFFVNIWPLWIFLIIAFLVWRRYKRA